MGWLLSTVIEQPFIFTTRLLVSGEQHLKILQRGIAERLLWILRLLPLLCLCSSHKLCASFVYITAFLRLNQSIMLMVKMLMPWREIWLVLNLRFGFYFFFLFWGGVVDSFYIMTMKTSWWIRSKISTKSRSRVTARTIAAFPPEAVKCVWNFTAIVCWHLASPCNLSEFF